ncbi:hypothetical protein NECAME_16118 [Necator americanus]|uniref:Uncharacterized protein n=1 Tax=Necator americanus TaxID=51031 RepID=W2TY86_NECAM|nr:hypothetical protein NECAME_16118 [Necator americanus]ETN86803.1 hypothetical protein NECAME_16118 [Necator americanus]
MVRAQGRVPLRVDNYSARADLQYRVNMGAFNTLLSIIFAAVWCGAVYYDVTYQPRLGHDWYVYKLVMLTNLNFVIITIFAVFALIGVFLGSWNHLRLVLGLVRHRPRAGNA